MKKIHLLIALIGGSMAFTSCNREDSDNVNQDKIYAQYRIVYEADKGKTFARATFRFSNGTGTLLELNPPAEVKSDNVTMPWKPALAYYESEYAGIKNSAAFSYSDHDNNTFNNTVNLTSAIAFPAIDTIDQSMAYSLTWVGDDIQAGESVIVTIDGANENDTQIFTLASVGSTQIILDQNKLGDLGVGTATIYMERWENYTINQATSAGGAVWSRYVATPQTIHIK